MVAGAIEMTLGLQVNQFLSALGLAQGQVLSLFGAAQILQSGFQKVWGAIEKGGVLNDLALRTGESIGKLYQLQQAFTVVGAGAESVSMVIRRFQRTLGDREHDSIFTKLGLSRDSLSKMAAPDALEKVADALGKIDKVSAAAASYKLFGREGASAMAMISRDAQSFRDAIAQTAESGRVWERVAAAFDEIGDTVELIKGKVATMWAGIASGLVPVFKQVLNYVNSIDWVGIGKQIGDFLNTTVEIFRNGEAQMLITLSMNAAFEQAINFLRDGFSDAVGFLGQKIVDLLPNIMELIVIGLGGVVANVGLELYKLLIKFEQWVADIVGFESGSRDFAEGLQNVKKWQDNLNESITVVVEQMLYGGSAPQTGATDALMKFIRDRWKPVSFDVRKRPGFTADEMDFSKDKGKNKPEASALEKIGLVLGGGAGFDYQRETAKNTAKVVYHVEKIFNTISDPNRWAGHV